LLTGCDMLPIGILDVFLLIWSWGGCNVSIQKGYQSAVRGSPER
jgi:hypothetical protein